MTDTVVTPQTVIQTLEIGADQVAVVLEKAVQVVTAGTQGPQGIQGQRGIQGPPGNATGFTGSVNISLGTYGGVLNITTVNGLVTSLGTYGM